MTNIDRLDKLLEKFYHKKTFTGIEGVLKMYKEVELDADYDKLRPILHKLVSEKLVNKLDGNKYQISFEGKFFFENTPSSFLGRPFSFGQKKESNNQTWYKLKMVATVINAAIIIIIGWATCNVSNKSNQYEKQIKVLEDSIQKINKVYLKDSAQNE